MRRWMTWTLLGLLCKTSLFPLMAKEKNYLFFEDHYLEKLNQEKKQLILIASGWSQPSLEKMQLTKNQQKQKRGFAPAYLLAARVYHNNGRVRVFYLTTTEIQLAYRQYLYQLMTGDRALKRFKDFEESCVTLVNFTLPQNHSVALEKSERLDYMQNSPNKELWEKLKSELNDLSQDSQNVIVGFTMHATGDFLLQIAKDLGIPYLANHPTHSFWIRKSYSRITYQAAGIPHPRGTYTPAKTLEDLSKDMYWLLRETKTKKIIIKLDRSAAGDGNKIIDFTKEWNENAMTEWDQAKFEAHILSKLEFPASYLRRFAADGAIIEEYLVGRDFTSPATMNFIKGIADSHLYYQYNQVLGGVDNQVFQGSQGPLPKEVRESDIIASYSKRITDFLSTRGVQGHVGIDFVVLRPEGQEDFAVYAIENNVRQTGTMYPYMSSQLLLGQDVLKERFINTFDGIPVPKFKSRKTRREFQKDFFAWLPTLEFAYNDKSREGLFVHLPTFASGYIAVTIIAKDNHATFAIMDEFRKSLHQFLIQNKYLASDSIR